MTPQDLKRIRAGLFAAGLGLAAFFMTLVLLQHTAWAQQVGTQVLEGDTLAHSLPAAQSAARPAYAQLAQATVVDLSLTKTNGLTEVIPNMTVIYTLTARNNSTATLTNVVVVDYLPANYQPAHAWAFGFEVLSVEFITFTMGEPVHISASLKPGASLSLVFSGTLHPKASGILTNTAIITAPHGVSDTNPANNTAVDADPISTTLITPEGVLQISQTDGVTQVVVGQILTYTIIVTNPTAFLLDDVRITDTLPAGFAISNAQMALSHAGPDSNRMAISKALVTGTVSLSPRAVVTLTLTGAVQFWPSAWLTNTATVAAAPELTRVLGGSALDVDMLLEGWLLNRKTYLPVLLKPGSQSR